MTVQDRPQLQCFRCERTPEQIEEYVAAALDEDMTASDYVWEEEGTLNPTNGHFACTTCYMAIGMPTTPRGWRAP